MEQENFLLKLILIVGGYSSVLLPFYFLVQYIDRKCKENHSTFSFSGAWWVRWLRGFAVGHPEYIPLAREVTGGKITNGMSLNNVNSCRWFTFDDNSFLKDCLKLFIYFSGIQLTLVSMGFFQERIITQGYLLVANPLVVERFDDAQFLVFVNRIFGFIVAGFYLVYDWKRQPVHVPPLYVHSITSISNTISSWCQYEALKYVSFLTQTVCKASKVIPTMIMGRLLRKESFPTTQYVLAFVLVSGASIFFISMTQSQQESGLARNSLRDTTTTTLSGLILMAGYLTLDAFTPNYQKKLMEASVSRWQMMLYVNAFSSFLCLVSLLQQMTFFSSLRFIFKHYDIFRDCCFLSLGSACGQIFIYATIEDFGPVVLSVLMTLRQIFSIILSALYFSHPVTATGIFGLFLVFAAIFGDIFRKYSQKNNNNKNEKHLLVVNRFPK